MKYTNFTQGRLGQEPNNAGGFSYEVDHWTQLERFLILGSETGTYYVTPQALSLQNAAALLKCLKEDPRRTAQVIRDISVSGRAAKVDPAIYALAIAASPKYCSDTSYALAVLPEVCRIGTHLFQFMSYLREYRGMGRAVRRSLGNWYLSKDIDQLQYQVAKYQQREGWSHADILRLSHPKTSAADYNAVFKYVTSGELHEDFQDTILGAVEWAKMTKDEDTLISLITDYNLPWETVPTEWLRNSRVRLALLRKMPMGAMVRQLGLYSSLHLTDAKSEGESIILENLGDAARIQRSRIHPFELLKALQVYSQGRGERGGNTWLVNQRIVGALDEAFYKSFVNVAPSNQRILLGIDISGSMGYASAVISGLANMRASAAAAAMAVMMVNVEPYCDTVAFDTKASPRTLTKRMSIKEAMQQFIPAGGTDCGSPIAWALENNREYDAFMIFTDSETWAGKVSPLEMYTTYREKINPKAKLITVAMCSNRFSLAPQLENVLDCVGFDTNTPALASNFLR